VSRASISAVVTGSVLMLSCVSSSAAKDLGTAVKVLPVTDRDNIRFVPLSAGREVLNKWIKGIAQDNRGLRVSRAFPSCSPPVDMTGHHGIYRGWNSTANPRSQARLWVLIPVRGGNVRHSANCAFLVNLTGTALLQSGA